MNRTTKGFVRQNVAQLILTDAFPFGFRFIRNTFQKELDILLGAIPKAKPLEMLQNNVLCQSGSVLLEEPGKQRSMDLCVVRDACLHGITFL